MSKSIANSFEMSKLFCNFALAFGNRIALTDRYALIKATDTSALPTANSLQLGLRRGSHTKDKIIKNTII